MLPRGDVQGHTNAVGEGSAGAAMHTEVWVPTEDHGNQKNIDSTILFGPVIKGLNNFPTLCVQILSKKRANRDVARLVNQINRHCADIVATLKQTAGRQLHRYPHTARPHLHRLCRARDWPVRFYANRPSHFQRGISVRTCVP